MYNLKLTETQMQMVIRALEWAVESKKYLVHDDVYLYQALCVSMRRAKPE